ncbi:Stp1/IreP family PP2C-type Ser/Thr phosphatase [Desulfotomaculum copahuensis]|uniref:Protein phosphatase n=1 Tax=Desulfotomaculum copahuensis TaxID=1838280 RepID=A0A1B7LE83_9FIRM|nr:Stp1/IreP family PP2C-type Ser/Thr phosphatase [Desulfotomaculum copahuensis]OAT81413.1 protein phosphatase [Desulfotomaculum copahuensis]
MKWSHATETGYVRRTNEDSLCICPDLGLFAVADGMGGHRAGEVASKTALEELERYLRLNRNTSGGDGALLARGVQEANRAVYRLSLSEAGCRGMGTTLSAALIRDDRLFMAHVGDSRGYLLRQGRISQLTEDHSLVQELVKSGGLTAEQAREHPRRNVLTRALGTGNQVDVDCLEVTLAAEDMILLCTDGLTGHLRAEEIAFLAYRADGPEQAVKDLVQAALDRGGTDNITIILLAVD